MKASIPNPVDYDVSIENGFLPDDPPLEILPDPYYQQWEAIARNLQGLILSRRLRELVDRIPVLSTERLHSEAEWRRAYSVLAFIAHAYIWGGEKPTERVPPSISIPFISTCKHFELPYVATYAGLVLWNWKPLFTAEPADTLNNLATILTFTGSLDESWFYLVSVAIEARGASVIPLMLDAIAAARREERGIVAERLRSFAELLDELGSLLNQMYDNCDPHVFYHRIRPYLAGGSNMAEAGLPNGVLFDNGARNQSFVSYSGGSNAQSSLIQFFDLVLGVEHRPTGEKRVKENPEMEGSAPPPPSHNFITEMRKYMPGPHRQFLEHVARVANLREFVHENRSDVALSIAYDACLAMLRAFRDKHIQMVSRYIVVKSRETRERTSSFGNHDNQHHKQHELPQQQTHTTIKDTAITKFSGSGKKLRGTGGTALIPFLKQARDETGEPAITRWAERLLTNGPAFGGSLDSEKNVESRPKQIVGLAGNWSIDDSEGGICHW